jgi:ATP-dependent helicase/nuclease subunit A
MNREIFFRSSLQTYAELAAARILGREVSLLMPWNGQIMEGVIDVIYERDGLLYLADYKTDRIAREELEQGAERYRQQAQIYAEAARLSLKREVAAFKLIFLRLGEAVEIPEKKRSYRLKPCLAHGHHNNFKKDYRAKAPRAQRKTSS